VFDLTVSFMHYILMGKNKIKNSDLKNWKTKWRKIWHAVSISIFKSTLTGDVSTLDVSEVAI